ncbi:hypothetical protein M5E88_07880 [Akkermansia muciniphila]|nr:hypothetical protein M5E88_07880 [Akkermansia muciniphila]
MLPPRAECLRKKSGNWCLNTSSGAEFGENVVNVMTLNAALDTLFPMSGM